MNPKSLIRLIHICSLTCFFALSSWSLFKTVVFLQLFSAKPLVHSLLVATEDQLAKLRHRNNFSATISFRSHANHLVFLSPSPPCLLVRAGGRRQKPQGFRDAYVSSFCVFQAWPGRMTRIEINHKLQNSFCI